MYLGRSDALCFREEASSRRELRGGVSFGMSYKRPEHLDTDDAPDRRSRARASCSFNRSERRLSVGLWVGTEPRVRTRLRGSFGAAPPRLGG
jgi:hypothetical protein